MELGPDAGHEGTAIKVGSAAPVAPAGIVGEAIVEGIVMFDAGRELDDKVAATVDEAPVGAIEVDCPAAVVDRAPAAADDDAAAAVVRIGEEMLGVGAAATDPVTFEVPAAVDARELVVVI